MFRLLAILLLMPGLSLAQPLWSEDQGQVTIDQTLLDEVVAKNLRQFDLPVDGRHYHVEVENVSEPNLGVTSISGRVLATAGSFFHLCRTESGATVAFIFPGEGTSYRLDHTSGYASIRAVDYQRLGPCAGAVKGDEFQREDAHPGPAVPKPQLDTSRSIADDGSRHDIIIGYTPAAEEVMGGEDFIRAEAQLAVDVANETYANSVIHSRLRLVHIMPTDYEETTAWDYLDHIEYLWTPNDGHMDNMLPMRETVGADFVAVFIDGSDFMGDVPTCGVGFVMQPHQINQDFDHLALSIISVQCAATNWTLAHEVGHNRGCAHNREDATVDGAYPFAYGYRFWDGAFNAFRTVMAYDSEVGGFVRIPFFSNPAVSYNGEPIGVWPGEEGEAHNTLVHNNTAPACAAFRVERTFLEFGWSGDDPTGLFAAPYPSMTEALQGSREGGTVAVFNGDPGFTGTLMDVRSYVHVGAGSTVLGGF